MQRIKKVLLILMVALTTLIITSRFTQAQATTTNQGNDYPIIFVHGFLGWGPEQGGPFSYWGGLTTDIPRTLRNSGHDVYEAVVGPISSNRHRAIELYYYIKGGTVDYGAYLAYRFGHERFGRTFDGLLETWDDNIRIHLVGHSKGGLTSRELANLIAHGCQNEIAFAARNPNIEISDLLAGSATGAIHSITTIATPNSGTTLFQAQNCIILRREFFLTLASIIGMFPGLEAIYDFRLDHFGIRREPNEHFSSYMDRILNSPIWESDALVWSSATVEHMIRENDRNLQTLPDIYYFSHGVQTTTRGLITGRHYAQLGTNPILIPFANQIGRFTDSSSTPRIDSNWFPNDGLVNVISMGAPFGHPRRTYNPSQAPVRGMWNEHPVMSGRWDHLEIIGIGTTPLPLIGRQGAVNQFYRDLANRLQALPSH